MNKVRITAIRKVRHEDLIERFENPIEHACDICEGQTWTSEDGKCPKDFCPEAWKSVREFVEALSRGEGNFFDGWMKDPMSAMVSCNDGFRPVSFYIEAMADDGQIAESPAKPADRPGPGKKQSKPTQADDAQKHRKTT